MNFTSVSDGDASDFGCEWNIPTMSSSFSSALLYPSNSCSFEIVKLNDDFGPAVIEGNVDALVVSDETSKKGEILNALRREQNLMPVEIVIVPMKMASDGNRISSTRIRNFEIDSSGNVLVD